MLIGGRHVGVPVSRMQDVLPFYRDVLGFRVVADEFEEGTFIDHLIGHEKLRLHVIKMVAPDGWMLELLEYTSHPSPRLDLDNAMLRGVGHAHFALTVRELDGAYKKLCGLGIRFVNPPRTSPSGKAKVAFCRDPEGNFIELVEIIS